MHFTGLTWKKTIHFFPSSFTHLSTVLCWYSSVCTSPGIENKSKRISVPFLLTICRCTRYKDSTAHSTQRRYVRRPAAPWHIRCTMPVRFGVDDKGVVLIDRKMSGIVLHISKQKASDKDRQRSTTHQTPRKNTQLPYTSYAQITNKAGTLPCLKMAT